MIPGFPGGLVWMAAGLPEEELLEAWPHLAAFFGALEPFLTSSSGNNPVRVPFLGGGSGLSLWPSLELKPGPWGKLCHLPAPLHPSP